ncbi:hypothetical protein WSK_3763 [Novosphingobium sp. Rr 2-17]|uniref:GrlR family regulatory protein n=1 Tax=Novosphingobium sp. Rr 2-17 TaxID=555793 RepID=UPI000269858C|nr:GrlR family regulatory protein [Novosphingobium sp. Rr 2-17]EIZ77752.1 hypothetical protein WSK_3763 [Novosphingobium sp. Rr 2-17]
MKNGLYSVTFSYAGDSGAGVVVLTDGKVRGGDTSFFYIGNLGVNGSEATGVIDVARHSPGLPNVFGVDAYQLTLNAKLISGGELKGTAKTAAVPGATLQVVMKLIAED